MSKTFDVESKMKKRRNGSTLSKDKEDSKIDDLLALTRTQRLLTMALSMPQVQKLFGKIHRKHYITHVSRKFICWKEQTLLYREEKLKLQQKKNLSAVPIQCLIRQYLAKNRVNKIRASLKEKEILKRIHSTIKIQCFLRKVSAKILVKQLRAKKSKQNHDTCALLIQRVFRGYLARGYFIILHRNRLIRQIRVWANGLSANLLHITDLQQIEQQALLQTAINFATIPSKPIYNLPSIAQIRSYRAGIFALQWHVQALATQRKLALKRLKQERQQMQYEEKHSITRETIDRLAQKRLLKKKEEEQYHLYLQQQEMLRRKEFIAAQFLKDLHNRALLEEREKKEKQWREKEKHEKELQWIEKVIQEQLQRENELMKHEETLSRYYQNQLTDYHKQRFLTKKEFQHIALLKKQQFFLAQVIQLSSPAFTSYKQKKPLTYDFIYQRVEKQVHIIYDHIYQYIHYLPFHKSYLEKLLKKFQDFMLPTFLLEHQSHVKPSNTSTNTIYNTKLGMSQDRGLQPDTER